MHTHAELIDDSNAAIHNHQQARMFLDKHNFMSKEDSLSAEGLSFVLLSLSHSTPLKILQEGARVVAILMMDKLTKSMGEEVIQYVEKQLTPIFNRMDKLAKQQKAKTKATKKAAEEVSAIKT